MKARELLNKIDEGAPEIILQQLGGAGRLKMMIGAKNFVKGKRNGNEYLMFMIGRNAKGVNKIIIEYDRGRDLYNVEFGRVRGAEFKTLSSVKGVYADQLKETIEGHTGMYLSL